MQAGISSHSHEFAATHANSDTNKSNYMNINKEEDEQESEGDENEDAEVDDDDDDDELAVLTGMALSKRAGAENTLSSKKARKHKKSALLKDKNLVNYAFDDQNDV